LHTHPLANLAFGEKVIAGGADVGSLLPTDPDCNKQVRATSEAQALGHDQTIHGGVNVLNPNGYGCGDAIREQVIHALQTQNGANDPSSDARGWPDFGEWPKWNDITHQKMWVDWIRRAYRAGLRVMVALSVNNKTIADMTMGSGDGPGDDRASSDLQVTEIIRFVGRHPDFMEIALSSSDVYRIVQSNRMAVILGMEVDHIGNFSIGFSPLPYDPPAPSQAQVTAEINRLYAMGVRYIFPIHVLDNAFGGTATYVPMFNVSNWRESGHPWNLRCSDPQDNIKWTYDPGGFDLKIFAASMAKTGSYQLPGAGPNCCPVSDPNCCNQQVKGNLNSCIGHRNSRGLTPMGVFAIKEMMRHGMLIDIDHMSQESVNNTLDVAEGPPPAPPLNYPLFSGHNGVRGALGEAQPNERALTAEQYARLGRLHGMAGVGSANLNAATWSFLYNQVVFAMGGLKNRNVLPGVGGPIISAGFGTDTNGLALGMPPRCGLVQNPLLPACINNECKCTGPAGDYVGGKVGCEKNCGQRCGAQYPPVMSCTGGTNAVVRYDYTNFPISTEPGGYNWDYNTVGVAHYGMLADFIEDVKLLPNQAPNLPYSMDGMTLVNYNLMNGAQYFLDTWKLCEQKASQVQ
jgi:hypothetical protein